MTQKTFEKMVLQNRRQDALYFTMIPNVIWFFDLSSSDFKLYNTIVKTTGAYGQAECFKSTQFLAKESGLSMGTVSQSKANLQKAGLITIQARKRSKNGRPIDHIIIVDIWEENTLFFKRVFSSDEETSSFSSLNELRARVFSSNEAISSLDETEEKPFNNNPPIEENPKSDEQLWTEVLRDLKEQMSKATYDQHLARTILLERKDGTMIIGMPNKYAKDWVENRLAKVISRTLSDFGIKASLQFKVISHES